MATVVRWASVRPPQCASTAPGSVVYKCHSFQGRHLGRKKRCWSGGKGSGRRGSVGRMGASDDTRSELDMKGSASFKGFATLALLFSDSQDGDGSIASHGELLLNLPSENDEANELYDKLAENAMTGVSITDEAGKEFDSEEELDSENEIDSEEELDSENEIDSEENSGIEVGAQDALDSEQVHVELWNEQVKTRISASAYQQASQLLEDVNKTLDVLEDGLVKHAEELEASALSEDFAFSESVADGWGQTASETSLQSLEIEQIREEVAVRDNLLEILRQEAIEASQTLKTATQAMVAAKGKITYLQEQLDTTSGFLQQEREATQRALDLFSSSLLALSDAEARVRELEKQVEIGMQGSQTEDYSAEVDSLMGLLDTKEKIIQSMRDENIRNANLLLAAAKTRKGLANAEKKVELFTAQVAILEDEVRSRDVLLKEVRDEMVRSTDALKLASQIKQDLHASRQKEEELTQALEKERDIVKNLQQELAENARALHAEQALRQTEKTVKDLKLEVEMLRGGVGARDDALRLMREEVDRSVEIIANAAENREAVRHLTSYVEELREELAMKDETIVSLREVLSRAETSVRHARPVPKPTPSVKSSTASAQRKPKNVQTVEPTKLKGKSSWRRQGNSANRPSPQS